MRQKFSHFMQTSSQETSKPHKLKILHLGKFYKPYRGGIETVLFNLCEELKKDYDLEVLVANQEKKTRLDLIEDIPVTRIASYGRLFSTSVCFSFPTELKKRKADILHL